MLKEVAYTALVEKADQAVVVMHPFEPGDMPEQPFGMRPQRCLQLIKVAKAAVGRPHVTIVRRTRIKSIDCFLLEKKGRKVPELNL